MILNTDILEKNNTINSSEDCSKKDEEDPDISDDLIKESQKCKILLYNL